MTVKVSAQDRYTCECPEPHRLAPDDAPEADLYLRISFDRTGEALGVERQLWACCRRAGELGFRVARVWTDNDKSATTGVFRPAFEGLLATRPRVVITWNTDRFVRLTKELERVIDLELLVHSVVAGIYDLSTPSGRAIAKAGTAFTQLEIENKSLRQREAGEQRARYGKPWWSRRPFGFEMNGEHVQAEAAALRKVYGDFLLTGNLSDCARWLNEQGHRTSTYIARRTGEVKGGNPWNTTSLRVCLEAPRNAAIRTYTTNPGKGKAKVTEEIGPAGWEPIVDESIWRATVHKLATPERRTNSKGGRAPRNLLTGIAVCGVCGATVRVRTVGRKGRENDRYYTCGGTDKGHIAHPVEWADGVVERRIVELSQDPEFRNAWAGGSTTDAVEVEALQIEKAACMERMDEATEDRADGAIDRATHLKIMQRNEARIAEINAELERIGSLSGLADYLDVELLWQDMDGMSLSDRRTRVQGMLRRIELKPGVQGARHVKDDVDMDPRLPGDEQPE